MRTLKAAIVYTIKILKKLWLASPFLSLYYLTVNSRLLNLKKWRFENPLVNIIIIGAQKSATSTLHQFIGTHPKIFMSFPVKEPGYFCEDAFILNYLKEEGHAVKSKRDILYKLMLKGYKGQPHIGESSTYYTIHHRASEQAIPERIKKEAGKNVKLIYILRNPFDRMVSHYFHTLRLQGIQGKSLMHLIQENSTFYTNSCYYTQLLPYLEVFGKNQIFLMDYDKFIRRDSDLIRQLSDFLEVGNNFNSTLEKSNVSKNKSEVNPDLYKFDSEWFNWAKAQFETEALNLKQIFDFDAGWDFSEARYT